MFIHKGCGAEVRQIQNRHEHGGYMGGYTETYKECVNCRCILQPHEYILAPQQDYTTMSGEDVFKQMVANFLGRS